MQNNLRVTSCLLCELRVKIYYTKKHEGCTACPAYAGKSHEGGYINSPQGTKTESR
jgi:hypothetical protein